MLALRRRGRYGLLYIDGDADFYQPEVNPLRGAASASDLTFATGRGRDEVASALNVAMRSGRAIGPA